MPLLSLDKTGQVLVKRKPLGAVAGVGNVNKHVAVRRELRSQNVYLYNNFFY